MRFGISHKGFVYTVARDDSNPDLFRVSVAIECYWLSDPTDSESWEEVKDSVEIGVIDLRNAHYYGWFECRTRWNGDRMSFDADAYGINDAVAFLADKYRPCAHEIAQSVFRGNWECDDCGAITGIAGD